MAWIPAGMTAEWVLTGVLFTLAGPILSGPQVRGCVQPRRVDPIEQ